MEKKKPLRAKITDGQVQCPVCGSVLCKAYYGGHAAGIELWCWKKCHRPVLLELRAQK